MLKIIQSHQCNFMINMAIATTKSFIRSHLSLFVKASLMQYLTVKNYRHLRWGQVWFEPGSDIDNYSRLVNPSLILLAIKFLGILEWDVFLLNINSHRIIRYTGSLRLKWKKNLIYLLIWILYFTKDPTSLNTMAGMRWIFIPVLSVILCICLSSLSYRVRVKEFSLP